MRTARNEWKGHSGIVGLEEADARLVVLEERLSSLRHIVSDRLALSYIVLPGTNRKVKGVYHYTVRLMQGIATPFPSKQVETLTSMEDGQLYLLHANQRRPVQLVPFFRLLESPRTQQNACYFYNKIQSGQVRFVSYHFAPEAELVRADEEVVFALSQIPAPTRTVDTQPE